MRTNSEREMWWVWRVESKANKQIKLVVVKVFENLERDPFARIYINIRHSVADFYFIGQFLLNHVAECWQNRVLKCISFCPCMRNWSCRLPPHLLEYLSFPLFLIIFYSAGTSNCVTVAGAELVWRDVKGFELTNFFF